MLLSDLNRDVEDQKNQRNFEIGKFCFSVASASEVVTWSSARQKKMSAERSDRACKHAFSGILLEVYDTIPLIL